MKLIRLLSPFLLATLAWSQIGRGTVSTNGVFFSYETRLEPPINGVTHTGGGTLTENKIIKRHICDFKSNSYFGYDLTAAPLGDGRFQVTFSPLTMTPATMAKIFPQVQNWTLVPLASQPASQIMREGETVALDLFLNPVTGQKVTEYITVKAPTGQTLSASTPARDFVPEDVQLTLNEPRLSINGKPVEPGFSRGGLSGAPLWVAVPNRGRFVFSLLPRTDLGLIKAGVVRGSAMAWKWGNDEFSIATDSRIGPNDSAFNLYVYNDPTYRPAKTSDAYAMGAGGKLESLVRR